MQIEWIKEFLVLIDMKNYSRAADSLHISQPLLSKHIKNLEEELGVSLFDRNTRTVSLSKFGKLYSSYAKRIVTAQQEFEAAVVELSNQKADNLSIGMSSAMARYFIPDMISDFAKEYNIIPHIIDAPSSDVLSLVYQNKCDLAFIRQSSPEENQDFFFQIPIWKDYLAAILPLEHPLAEEEQVSITQLSEDQSLFLSEASLSTRYYIKACEQAHITPIVAPTVSRSETLVHMVENGLGVTYLMGQLAATCGGHVAIVPITPPQYSYVMLVYNKNVTPTAISKLFVEYIAEHRKDYSDKNGNKLSL